MASRQVPTTTLLAYILSAPYITAVITSGVTPQPPVDERNSPPLSTLSQRTLEKARILEESRTEQEACQRYDERRQMIERGSTPRTSARQAVTAPSYITTTPVPHWAERTDGLEISNNTSHVCASGASTKPATRSAIAGSEHRAAVTSD